MANTYSGISSFLNCDLVALASRYNYSPENILVLQLNEEALRRNFPTTYRNLLSCDHQRDNRSPIAYGRDLVASWLLEDYMLHELTNPAFSVELAGADHNRVILPHARVTNESDYRIIFHDGRPPVNIELASDYTGFWHRTQKMHLRDNKYKHLRHNNALLLAFSIPTTTFAIIDLKHISNVKYISSHRFYGYKPAYEIDLTNHPFKHYTVSNLIASLNAL